MKLIRRFLAWLRYEWNRPSLAEAVAFVNEKLADPTVPQERKDHAIAMLRAFWFGK